MFVEERKNEEAEHMAANNRLEGGKRDRERKREWERDRDEESAAST